MFSTRQQADFKNAAISDDFLDIAVLWINEHISMDEVYDEDDIKKFCARNYKPGDIFPDDEIFEAGMAGKHPEDVFNQEQLENWAMENGFVKENP